MALTSVERVARYRLKHPERIKTSNSSRNYSENYRRQKEIWVNNPRFYLWKNARDRCRKKQREFTIKPGDIIINEVCPYLGILLVPMSTNNYLDNVMTLDRIDNSKGYVPGNIEVISYRANRIKCDATAEELLQIGTRMKGLQYV